MCDFLYVRRKYIDSNDLITFSKVWPYFFSVFLIFFIVDSNDRPTFARVVMHPGLKKRVIWGGLHTLFHNHNHTHTHTPITELWRVRRLRFGSFCPQSGLMEMLCQSAPHSTRSQAVRPPGESIPEAGLYY